MDETPCYIDMTGDKTLDFVGVKNVDAMTTGNDKSRFTVVLLISCEGRICKTMIILKGLVHIPKCDVPDNIKLTVSKGGSMSEPLMLNWIDNIYMSRGPHMVTQPSLLLMDSHRSHTTDKVINALKNIGTRTKIIPPKATCYLQPLDVTGGVNVFFKREMRERWRDWLVNGEKEYTKGGNRRKPSYSTILGMVSDSVNNVTANTISRSFELSGIGSGGSTIAIGHLNGRLRGVLGCHEGLEEVDEEDDPFRDDEDDEEDAEDE